MTARVDRVVPVTNPVYQRRPAGAPHSFELLDGDAVEARLEWRQDAINRAGLGWWFVRVGHARAPRRLNVDQSIADLAADERRPSARWSEDADSLAMLTTGAALTRAEQLLRGHIAPVQSGDAQFESGRYEILVTGCDAVTLAVALPTTAIYEWGGIVVIADELDDASLRATLDRLAHIGAEIVGVLPADDP